MIRLMQRQATLILAFTLIGCAFEPGNSSAPDSEPVPANQPREPDMETAARQANDFAMRIYGQVATGDNGNLFFSPLSIHSALSMAYAGSGGETAQQMREVLGFEFAPDEDVEHQAYSMLLNALNNAPTVQFEMYGEKERTTIERPAFELVVANRLWGEASFPWNPAYIQLTQQEYLAGLEEVNFSGNAEGARETINSWVEKQTRDRIRDLIPAGAIDAMTRLVLTNAIYFKANWLESFSDYKTKPEPFYFQDGSQSSVPTMTQTEHFNYGEFAGWQALEMPYERKALSMLLVLPADGNNAMATVEREIASGEALKQMASMQRAKVDVWLPRFSLTQEIELNTVLSEMGMPLAFSDRADFSGMTPDADLFITRALHKAFVDVDEEGTEAAAATAAVVGLTAMPPPEETKLFRADRPFLFMIRHNESGAILFIGRVMDPR